MFWPLIIEVLMPFFGTTSAKWLHSHAQMGPNFRLDRAHLLPIGAAAQRS